MKASSNQRHCGILSSNAMQTGVDKKRVYHIWPLRSEEDYFNARQIVDELSIKGEGQLNTMERDQLDIFATLIEKYEDEHYDIKPIDLSPVEFLKILLEEHGMNPSNLGRILGDRSLGYRIISGERDLSKTHIKILSEYFKVDASAFL